MAAAPALQRFVNDELARSPALADRVAVGTLALMQQSRHGGASHAERQQQHAAQQAIESHRQLFQARFAAALRERVTALLDGEPVEVEAEGEADHGDGTSLLGGLRLVDEHRVESDIEVSRAQQVIDATAEWEARELQTFTSTLSGQAHVSTESNPLRPQVFAQALWEAVCAVTQVPVQRAVLLRHGATVLAGLLKLQWAAACTRLESQGVEPGAYRTLVISSVAGPRAPAFDVTQPGGLEGLLPAMPAGGTAPSATLTASPRPPPSPLDKPVPPAPPGKPVPAAPPGLPLYSSISQRVALPSRTIDPAFELALQRLDELVQLNARAVAGIPPPTPLLADHRSTLTASAGDLLDRQVIELLSRLFEAVLGDTALTPGIRAVMARLQVSALRIALVDSGMLSSHEHPVWQLMNRIATACEAWPQPGDPRAAALQDCCESLADRIAQASAQDTALYRRELARLDSFLSLQVREAQATAAATIDLLSQAEQRDELERRLSRRLADQLATVRCSTVVRRFVTTSWAQVLAESQTRHGVESELTASYGRATEDLLWSLQLPDHPQSRQRLVSLLPGLLQRLRAGMALIAMPPAEQQSVLDELMAAHAESLRPSKAQSPGSGDAASREPTPHELVQRMRAELVDAPPPASGFSDSLIDLNSMETVPAALMPEPAAVRDDPTRRIDALAPGDRLRLFLHGRWSRVQLLWRSPRGGYFLFAGEAPGRTHSITRRALERLGEERLIKPFSSAPLIQRCVDAMVRRLERGG